jgi:hypothetical protein
MEDAAHSSVLLREAGLPGRRRPAPVGVIEVEGVGGP